jgi:arylsulfatase A-like enzyme
MSASYDARLSRREFLCVSAGAAAAAMLPRTLLAATSSAPAGGKPHIIFCMADDLGYGDVAYNGHKTLKTPVLDEMARTGLRFNRFHASAPNCSPTRASSLTGRHHNRCGVLDHSRWPINPDETTFADALAASGYVTAHVGKWHLGNPGAGSPFNPSQLGFQHYFSTVNNAPKVDPKGYYDDGRRVASVSGEDSHIIVAKALRFLRRGLHAGRPVAMVLWFHTPHTPHGSTPEYLAMYKGAPAKARAYYASITAMDHAIGVLRKGLDELGIRRSTLLVFCSDNGPTGPGSTGGLAGRKGGVSEGGLRVPGLIEWPAVITKGRTTDVPASTADLYPTILAAAGIDSFGPKRVIDGENLLPLIRGEAFRRRGPIRFCHRNRKAAILPDGTYAKDPERADPGYTDWLNSVLADQKRSLARVAELGGRAKRGQ